MFMYSSKALKKITAILYSSFLAVGTAIFLTSHFKNNENGNVEHNESILQLSQHGDSIDDTDLDMYQPYLINDNDSINELDNLPYYLLGLQNGDSVDDTDLDMYQLYLPNDNDSINELDNLPYYLLGLQNGDSVDDTDLDMSQPYLTNDDDSNNDLDNLQDYPIGLQHGDNVDGTDLDMSQPYLTNDNDSINDLDNLPDYPIGLQHGDSVDDTDLDMPQLHLPNDNLNINKNIINNISSIFPEKLLQVFHLNNSNQLLNLPYVNNNLFLETNRTYYLKPQNIQPIRQLFNWYIEKNKHIIPTEQFYNINVNLPYKWRTLDVSNYTDQDFKNDVKKLWPNPAPTDNYGEMTVYDYLFSPYNAHGGKYDNLKDESKNTLKRIVLTVKNTKEQIKTNPNEQVSQNLTFLDLTINGHEGHCEARLMAIINDMSKILDQTEQLLKIEELKSEELESEESVHSDDLKNDIHSFKLSITEPLSTWHNLDVSNYSDDELKNDIQLLWPNIINQFNASAADMLFNSHYNPNNSTNDKAIYDNLSEPRKTTLKQIVLITKRLKAQYITEHDNQIKSILELIDKKVYDNIAHQGLQKITTRLCSAIPCFLSRYENEILHIINEDYNLNIEDNIEDSTEDKTENKASSNIENLIVTEFKKIAFENTAIEISHKFENENVMVINTFKNLYKEIFSLNFTDSNYLQYYAEYAEEEITINDILKAFTNNLNRENLSLAANNILNLVTDEQKGEFFNTILTVKLTLPDYCKSFGINLNDIDLEKIQEFADTCINDIDNDEDYEYWTKTFTSLKNWTNGTNTMSLEDLNYINMIYTNNINQYNINDIFNIFNLTETKTAQFASDHPEILYLYLTDQGFFENVGSANL